MNGNVLAIAVLAAIIVACCCTGLARARSRLEHFSVQKRKQNFRQPIQSTKQLIQKMTQKVPQPSIKTTSTTQITPNIRINPRPKPRPRGPVHIRPQAEQTNPRPQPPPTVDPIPVKPKLPISDVRTYSFTGAPKTCVDAIDSYKLKGGDALGRDAESKCMPFLLDIGTSNKLMMSEIDCPSDRMMQKQNFHDIPIPHQDCFDWIRKYDNKTNSDMSTFPTNCAPYFLNTAASKNMVHCHPNPTVPTIAPPPATTRSPPPTGHPTTDTRGTPATTTRSPPPTGPPTTDTRGNTFPWLNCNANWSKYYASYGDCRDLVREYHAGKWEGHPPLDGKAKYVPASVTQSQATTNIVTGNTNNGNGTFTLNNGQRFSA